MNHKLRTYCESLTRDFGKIPAERKRLLDDISRYIISKRNTSNAVKLIYICTHNSRRSHFGQIWAHIAAKYYGVGDVSTFSGGTEATAFNVNAINAVKRAGLEVIPVTLGNNTTYHLRADEKADPIVCFSKVYNDTANPQSGFAAIMTCSDAEENCPFIPGAEWRIATTYDDPKAFDNSPQQDEIYDARCRQIALETFYVFSKVN